MHSASARRAASRQAYSCSTSVEGLTPDLSGRPEVRSFIAHGRRDPVIDVAFARSAKEQLEAGGLRVEYHETDAAHHVDPAYLPAAIGWLGE